MSVITTILSTDVIADSRAVINTNFANLNADKLETSAFNARTVNAKPLSSNVVLTTADIADSSNKRYVTDANLTVIGNTSGTNTGDQTLPVKATAANLDTGTDDAKFATALAIKNSHNVPSVAPGTSGNVLTSNGTDWVSSPVTVLVLTSSTTNQIAAADTTRTTTSTTYTKLKDITVRVAGVINAYFEIQQAATAGNTVYGRIYVNGVAVGTERTETTNSGSFNSYAEDIPVAAGDLVQLYCKSNIGSQITTIKNFRIRANTFYVVNTD